MKIIFLAILFFSIFSKGLTQDFQKYFLDAFNSNDTTGQRGDTRKMGKGETNRC